MKWPGWLAWIAFVVLVGCHGTKPIPPISSPSPVPLSIHRPEGGSRVFSGEDETAAASTFPFEGATGSVRLTMEVASGGTPNAPGVPTVNDVLFQAVGEGRIAIGFRRPTPGHPEGRVTIRCRSGDEESEAEFEPAIWLGHPSAIVTFEPVAADPANPVVEGREVVLARYVARNLPSDIRLTLAAVFSKDPIAPRVKAGAKPPR